MRDGRDYNFYNNILQKSELLLSSDQVNLIIDQLAEKIKKDFYNKKPLALAVMRGGAFTAIELLKRLNFPIELDYLEASRYGSALQGSQLNWRIKPKVELKGRSLLLIDDIFDQGITLQTIIAYLKNQQVAEVKTAVLVVKDVDNREVQNYLPDYVGIHLPNKFLYGCGMDIDGYWRNLNAIYALPEEYIKILED